MSFTIFSLNINNDRRINGQNFANLNSENRRDLLFQMLDGSHNAVLLQEIDRDNVGPIIAHLAQFYMVYYAKYTEDDNSFIYVSAFKLKPRVCKSFYFSKSGMPTSAEKRLKMTKDEKFTAHCETEYEKSYLIAEFDDYVIVNVHLGLPSKHRLIASKMLCDRVSYYDKVIICGDFNQFDPQNEGILTDQVKIYEDNGFVWASKHIDFTFISFPFDIERKLTVNEKTQKRSDKFYLDIIGQNNIDLVTCALDAVFVRGFNANVEAVTNIMGNIRKFTDRCTFQHEFLKHIYEPKNIIVSDHMAIIISIN